jgi:hypothetical protein
MNKNRWYLTGLGLIMVALLVLAGCQSGAGEPASAAPAKASLSEEGLAVTAADPADRKSFNYGYVTS